MYRSLDIDVGRNCHEPDLVQPVLDTIFLLYVVAIAAAAMDTLNKSTTDPQEIRSWSLRRATENARHEFAAPTYKGGKCET